MQGAALSSPTVSIIGSDDFDIDEMPCQRWVKLVNALDRFLLSRGGNKMRDFSLSWRGHCEDEIIDMDEPRCLCIDESFRVITWIKNALSCNVETLSLDMVFYEPNGELLPFPSSVFKCASLRSLEVDMMFAILKTPSFSFCSNMETLQLSNIHISDEGFFKWISFSCKLLKNSTLSSLQGINIITIENLCLDDFYYYQFELAATSYLNISGEKIEKIHIDCSNSINSTVVNIIAPKVEYLYMKGNMKNNRSLGDLDCLQEAFILMEPISDKFDKVLSSLYRVKVLILNEAQIKDAYKDEGMEVQLHEVLELRMKIGSFTDDLVPAIVRLLKGAPKLCTLCLQYKPTLLDPRDDVS